MELRAFKEPFGYDKEGVLVTYEVSNCVGMCAQKCSDCHCLMRIIQGCIAMGIEAPAYEIPKPKFAIKKEQLRALREELLKLPEPEVW